MGAESSFPGRVVNRCRRELFGVGALCALAAAIVFCGGFPAVAAATLGDALDAPALTWETFGDSAWTAETGVTHDGVDAARSGPVADYSGGLSGMRTTVTGPGRIGYWLTVDAHVNHYAMFKVDGVRPSVVLPAYGQFSWTHISYDVPAGIHLLSWEYHKDTSFPGSYSDAAFVDQVVWTPNSPQGSMAINEGAATTYSRAVNLDSAVLGATQMRFRDSGGTWSGWETYADDRAWVLPVGTGTGTRTVEAEYKNAGGTTISLSDGITVVASIPTIVSIESTTHPDPAVWYPNADPRFSWEAADDNSAVLDYSFALDHDPTTVPDEAADTSGDVRSVVSSNVVDGEWWFHVRAHNADMVWGPAAHVRIRIDRTPTARLSTSRTSAYYGNIVTFTGSVSTSAGPVAGHSGVTLWRRLSGSSQWSRIATLTWSPTGMTYVKALPVYANATYQVHVDGAPYVSAVSNLATVRAKAYLSLPWLSLSRPMRYRTFSAYGDLKPRHAGTTRIIIRRYYSGSWHSYATRYATNYNYRYFTRWRLALRLPAGRYSLYAYHYDTSHLATASSTRVFTVY